VGEARYTVQLREDDDGCESTEGYIELAVPSGVDYHLDVIVSGGATCYWWNGSSWQSGCSGVRVGAGLSEYVFIGRGESCFLGLGDGESQTMDVTLDVRWVSGGACAAWTMSVSSGNGC
jgi:hypothetical protein